MTIQKNVDCTPKKVMIVEDHVLFREGLTSLFQKTPDFEVIGEAGSVQEGIENARSLHPEIILMDFTLPDGTGLDATKAIIKEMPECKIVFLTVHEADEKVFAAIRAGAKGYLPKNVAGSNLITSLRSLENDEVAITRKTVSRIVEEFSRTNLPSSIHEEIYAKLSSRELDVLSELQSGDTNSEIAEKLYISENTVKHHVRSIMNKLDVKNRREASLIAQRAGLPRKSSKMKNN